jgi:hypothetical protein
MYKLVMRLSRSVDKSLAFFYIFESAAQLREFYLDRLKKTEERNHKRVDLRGEYID